MFTLKHSLGARPRRRRGITAAVIGLMAASALAACSTATPGTAGAASGAPADGPKVSGSLTVSFLSGQAYIDDAISSFKAQNPGLTVQTTQAVSNTYQPQIRAQLDAKHAPDVMFVWGGSGNAMATKILAEAGELQSLNSSPWVKTVGSTANSLVTYNGKVYALNSFQNPTGVEYNTDLLKKLKVKVPTTFSEMLDFCRTVSSKGVVACARGAQTGYLSTEVPLELANTLVYSKDPKFAQHLADGSVKWSTSKLWKNSLTTALKEYLKMQDAKCFQDNPTGYSDAAADQLVAAGKALGVDIIASNLPTLKKDAPTLKFDMFSLPATEDAADTVLTLNTGSAWGVAASSDNKKAAVAFVNYMGQPDQLEAAAKANFGVPYTPSSSTKMPAEMKGVEKQYLSNKVALWQTNFWPGYQVKQTMIAECQNLLVGKQTVQGVVAAVQKALGDS
jgi:raffinose/stachyose/melibiose transport system substrate-binding protein